jgi:hypothetical protein
MGGGLLQLVAYGAQDVYLTGNPQITFFKVVYRRHTNFAIEAIEQTATGSNSLGSRATFQLTRNGDLIHRIYFYGKIKNKSTTSTDANKVALVPNFGQKLLKTIELEIGGQRIDKHYSEWLYIWNELSLPIGNGEGYYKMIGANKENTCTLLGVAESYELYVPLEFWFCRNVGLALPLIALQYHEVKVKIDFESKDNCLLSGSTSAQFDDIKNASLWVDYIFLDTDERRRFAQLSHEYLIEQLQFTGTETLNKSTNRIKLNFNHPCKELIWVAKSVGTHKKSRWYDYNLATAAISDRNAPYSINSSNFIEDVVPGSATYNNPFKSAILQLNGNDRFAKREGLYFTHVQPYQHHTNVPVNNPINVYSFALKPEDHQPSGTLNMSRIDTATLMVEVKDPTENTGPNAEQYSYDGINIYAVNYNVLRILSGMGGLAYSN